MTPIAPLVLALALPLGCDTCSHAPAVDRGDRRALAGASQIRPLDRKTDAVVARALQASPTVRDLAGRLHASAVIVYVQMTPGLSKRAMLTFMAGSAEATFVLIRIELRQTQQERIAALAHELTHAVEIATARPPVRNESELAVLYRTIGRPVASAGEYESAAAIANERRVRREIAREATRPRRRSGSE